MNLFSEPCELPTIANLRKHGVRCVVKGPHVMFNDSATGRRIIDYWPSTARWRNPHTSATGFADRDEMLAIIVANMDTLQAVMARKDKLDDWRRVSRMNRRFRRSSRRRFQPR